jgi:hypothetical protein
VKEDPQTQDPSAVRLLLGMLGFVLVGTPLVFYLWSTINELLSGHVGVRDLLALPVLGLFVVLLIILGRSVSRWNGASPVDSH